MNMKSNHLKVCLFCTCFCVCGVKNVTRYLVIVKIIFYTMGLIKNISLKHSFREAVFTYFFNCIS